MHQVSTVRKPRKATEHVIQAIVDEAEKDLNQMNGPQFVKDRLKDRGIFVSRCVLFHIFVPKGTEQCFRDAVAETMHLYYPEGFDTRMPGGRKIVRKALFALGIWHEVSGDGHEKLGSLALQMGSIGLPIYGLKEKWSDNLLYIVVVPNTRNAFAAGHIYLDFLEKYLGELFSSAFFNLIF